MASSGGEPSPDKGAASPGGRIEVKKIASNRMLATQRSNAAVLKFQPGRVIEPDTNIVIRAYSYDTSLVDGMTFREGESHNWDIISQDFVLGVGN